ncbi:DUF202 domain-containing protein [Nocardia uniformis]|uniref:DUF202 domain-containing protein n=1 Tax=Nocardia uniformis TaxID=53432 RepID=A0A849BRH5_9NOCA|nr:DUF202 domain-containing protein [Nocardia uniformis]NNH69272.1 DUF202 domain-containing protein [Nocardia uniformis]
MTDGAADTGLAAERTALAWRRTAASACVVAALLGHHVLMSGYETRAHDESPWALLTSALIPLAAAVMLLGISVLSWRRNRVLRGGDRRAAAAPVVMAAVAVAAVAVIMLLATGVAVIGPDDWTVGLPGQSERTALDGREAQIWRGHATPNRRGRPDGL